MTQRLCPICGGDLVAHDVVDFNKNCEEPRGQFLPLALVPVYYFICQDCEFCCAPELMDWDKDQFKQRIYNDDYVKVDPDYLDVRPKGNARWLDQFLGTLKSHISHLDYGGGNGVLSQSLRQLGWESLSFDPFVEADDAGVAGKRFNLISAYEVFEHVPNPADLTDHLLALLADEGMVIFSTLTSDGDIAKVQARQRLTWWYASPRNGHISLYSQESLRRLWGPRGLQCYSFNRGLHIAFRSVPKWASQVIAIK